MCSLDKYSVREHYEVEKKLAARLLNGSKEERCKLYTELYDELFRRIPSHPMLRLKVDTEERQRSIQSLVKLLKCFVNPLTNYMEIGPGDCALAAEVSKYVKIVVAVDVSNELTKNTGLPENLTLLISDGTSMPEIEGGVDFAFSNQLMEHLHPDDAEEQLENIYNSLAVGGQYLCSTPSRWSGPHDVSQFYEEVSTGFHLKEFSYNELSKLFKKAGFKGIKAVIYIKGKVMLLPLPPLVILESMISLMPYRLRKRLAKITVVERLLGIMLIGVK